ncbi:MAG: polysaccharide pyruvyl transferase family protein [Protaetiibacter sp.]
MTAAAARPSVLLLTGWNFYNIGDVSHTPGFLRILERTFPEARVTVLAATYPDELAAYLRERFGDVTVLPMEFLAGRALSAEMIAAFEGADAVVLNSGMTLSFGYYGLDWEKYLHRILAFLYARERGVPYGVWAHSFDRIDPPADILYRDVLGGAEFLYTRDSRSLALLADRGVRAARQGFCPDSGFGFDLRDDVGARQFLAEHGLEAGEFLSYVPRLDIHRFRTDGREQEHARQARELISSWIQRTDRDVLIAHETISDVAAAKEMILEQLDPAIRTRVVYQPEYWLPDRCQSIFAASRLVISAEMHSVILGIAAGTPALHPYFAEAGLKQWMLEDLGVGDWMFDMDEDGADRILEKACEISADHEAARRRAAETARRARELQAQRAASLRELAQAHASARRAAAIR